MKLSTATALIFVLTLLLWMTPLPVEAHANLVSADPAPGATTPATPSQVCMTFSEQLEKSFSTVSVLDSSGRSVGEGSPTFSQDDLSMCLALTPLPNGVYIVSWRTQSAVDGHIVESSFPFGVGNASVLDVQTSAPTVTSQTPSPTEAVLRWAGLLGETGLVGSVVFELTVWKGTRKALRSWSVKRELASFKSFSHARWASLAVFSGASVGRIVLETYNSASGSFSPSALSQLILGSRFGAVWLAQVCVVASLCAILVLAGRGLLSRARSTLLLLAAGAVLLATTSLDSHGAAAVTDLGSLPLLADWVHLFFASFWLGGLFQLVLLLGVLSKLVDQGSQLRETLTVMIPRFSLVAIVSLAFIGVTGLFSAFVQVGSFAALFDSDYGKLLLFKIALVVLIVSLGAVNQFVLERSIATSQAGPSRLRRSVRIEASLAVGLLLVVGVLTGTSPGATLPSLSPPAPAPRGVTLTGENMGVISSLTIYPDKAGINDFTVALALSGGGNVTDVSHVMLSFTQTGGALGTSTEFATPTKNGTFSVTGADLEIPGNYSIEIDIARSKHFDSIATLNAAVQGIPRPPTTFGELPLTLAGASPNDVATDSHGIVWFTVPQYGSIGSYDPSLQSFKYYHVPWSSAPNMLAVSNGGVVWFTDTQGNAIGSMDTTTGTFSDFIIPTPNAQPGAVALSFDGTRVWFTEVNGDKIGLFNASSGQIREFPVPTLESGPLDLAVSPATGLVWFTESTTSVLASLNPANGTITAHSPAGRALGTPVGVAVDKYGDVWFSEHTSNQLTVFDPSTGSFKSYPLPIATAAPYGLAVDEASGAVFFAEHVANEIGVLSPGNGTIRSFPISEHDSNTQWITVDQSGNAWFAEASGGRLGVYGAVSLPAKTPAGSYVFDDFLLVAAIVLVATSGILAARARRVVRERDAAALGFAPS